jgi:enoyl-[acyl-carrier protein] reductase II
LSASSGIRFVTTSAGSPAKFIAPLKDAGIVVYHAVPTLDAALKCVDAGIDGLVVEGGEGRRLQEPRGGQHAGAAAGHPRRTDVPLIAAGGIVDGRGMAAAFALGAEGIQMGTRFVCQRRKPGACQFQAMPSSTPRDRHLGAEQEVHALHPRAQDGAPRPFMRPG